MSLWLADGSCAHKTIENHRVVFTDGRRIWTCSHCKAQGPWTDSWGYQGNIECPRYWKAQIDFVACSDACKTALCKKHGVDGRPPRVR